MEAATSGKGESFGPAVVVGGAMVTSPHGGSSLEGSSSLFESQLNRQIDAKPTGMAALIGCHVAVWCFLRLISILQTRSLRLTGSQQL